MTHLKTITHLPMWASGDLARHEITSTAEAYQHVPVFRMCVELIADSVRQLPAYWEEMPITDTWEYPISFRELTAQMARELLLHGSTGILKIRNGLGKVVGLQVLSAPTLSIELESIQQGQAQRRFRQQVGGKTYPSERGWWTEEEVVLVRLFNPSDQVGHGIAPAETALSAAKLLHYLSVFQAKYFEEGALNVWLVGVRGGAQESDKNRLRDFFTRQLQGLRHAFGIQVVSGEIHAQQLSSHLNELEIEMQKRLAKEDILNAFGVPEDLLRNAAWVGTVENHQKQFWQNTVRPLAELIAEGLSRGLGGQFRFVLEELSLFQKDESERAGALAQLVGAGVPLETAWKVLGYHPPLLREMVVP